MECGYNGMGMRMEEWECGYNGRGMRMVEWK